MKIIFLAYREWALEVYPAISRHPKITQSILIKTHEDLMKLNLPSYDLLITLGWSEELGPTICKQIEAIGLHCAELDRYSYGTPIQLQVIDGVLKSKHRIFPFLADDQSPRAHNHSREYSHEIDLYLHGSMKDIFNQLTYTSIPLINLFLDDYPNIVYKKWPSENIIRKKRTAGDSKINKNDLNNYSTMDLYNFIRGLEEPYPNAYFEDEIGYLYFEKVAYKKK